MWRVGLCVSLVLGCTKPNPNNCESGVCSDPSLPYCDVSGAISGTPKTCVAVSCTANAFEQCDGDAAITCNASGDNYTALQCSHGCDATVGCRACDAGETVCANGQVQTCDATGAVTASQQCPLGCFEDQPRCRDIDPSNGLAQYMDMAAAGPDLIIDGGSFLVPSHIPSTVHVVLLPAPSGGVPLAVIPVRSLTVTGAVQIAADDAAYRAPVFLVSGAVEVNGSLTFIDAESQDGTAPPPGGVLGADCAGSDGKQQASTDDYFTSGGGGGGGATAGGAGGAQFFAASTGGPAYAHADLQPLRGGCAGGGGSPRPDLKTYGGGAIQITSGTSIHFAANATISVNGISGLGDPGDGSMFSQAIATGGGSGGGILLEAPTVKLDSGALLVANGGAGVSGDGHAGTSPSGRTAARGGVCTQAAAICTNGGDGGSIDAAGKSAGSITYTNQRELHTGAGGGAAGFIRINTASGTFQAASDSYLSPMPSSGTLKTR